MPKHWQIAEHNITVLEPERDDDKPRSEAVRLEFTHDPNDFAIKRLRVVSGGPAAHALELVFDAGGECVGNTWQSPDRQPFDWRPQSSLTHDEIQQLPLAEQRLHRREHFVPEPPKPDDPNQPDENVGVDKSSRKKK